MNNKKALVTGASSGIGEEFCRQLNKAGYEITCVARSEDKLRELVSVLGNNSKYIVADLSDKKQLASIEKELNMHRYDLLVNNAGYGLYGIFSELPLEKQENIIDLNITSLVRLSHVFLSNARQGDALINVSSVLSMLTYGGGAIYAGTKGFVTVFTESLWYEYRKKGIYVMALLPGMTTTRFHRVAMQTEEAERPSFMSYPPEVVVKDAIKALRRRKKPTVTSGRLYRYIIWMSTRLMGRRMMIKLMGKNNPVFA